jgi:hypothetical protein
MDMCICIVASGQPILGKPWANCKSFLAVGHGLGSLCGAGKTLVGGREMC